MSDQSQDNLQSTYRRPATAGNLLKQYQTMRKSFEGCDELSNWRQSGQGNPNFYPGFCSNNAVHVLMFYIFSDAKAGGEDDLQLCVLSQMDPSVQSNSMPTPSQTVTHTTDLTTDTELDSDSTKSRGRKRDRHPMSSVNSTLRQLTSLLKLKYVQEETRARKRDRPDVSDSLMKLIEQKVWYLKRRKELVDLGDQSSLGTMDNMIASLNRKINSLAPAASPASTSGIAAATPVDLTTVGAAVPRPNPKLQVPMWMGFLKDHESLRKAMDMIEHRKFTNGAGGYDEGFAGETWFECTPNHKKVLVIKFCMTKFCMIKFCMTKFCMG